MKQALITSVALAAIGTNRSTAHAQSVLIGAPTQGQAAFPPLWRPLVTVNDNDNTTAIPVAGPFAPPTLGNIVVHINGRVETGVAGVWSSADTRFFAAPAGSPGAAPITSIGTGGTSASAALGAILGNNGTGTAKLQPQAIYSYALSYFGADAMAINGLRYGAVMELRQSVLGEQSGSNASTYTSGQRCSYARVHLCRC